MATLTAEYLDDLGRVRLDIVDAIPNVPYRIDRSEDLGQTWEPVRGAQNIVGDVGTVFDYEYAPHIENRYRLIAPIVSDEFERAVQTPPGGLVLPGGPGDYASTPDAGVSVLVGDADFATTPSDPAVAPSVDAGADGLLLCTWTSWDSQGETFTVPMSMSEESQQVGTQFATNAVASEVVGPGATGTRSAVLGVSDRWSAASAFIPGAAITIEDVQEDYSDDGSAVSVTTAAATTGWWFIAVNSSDANDDTDPVEPSGSGWILIADSGTDASGTSRNTIWAREVTSDGVQSVSFDAHMFSSDNFLVAFLLSGTDINFGLNTTGDLDVAAEVWRESWAAPGAEETIAAKYRDSTDDRSWRFALNANNTLRFQWTTDGTTGTIVAASSSVPPVTTPEARIAFVRVTFVASTGEVRFFTSTAIDGPWVQLGSTATFGESSIFVSSADIEVGARNGGQTARWNGVIRDVVGFGSQGRLFNPRFRSQPASTPSFVDDEGNTWTVQGNAEIDTTTWGDADTGQTWQEFVDNVGIGEFEVRDGAARATLEQSQFGHGGNFLDVDLGDIEIQTDVLLAPFTSSGVISGTLLAYELHARGDMSRFGGLEGRLLLDNGSSGNGRSALLSIETASPGVTVNVGEWQPGQRWRIKMRLEGDRLQAKAWNTANAEPSTWHVIRESAEFASGTVGLGGFSLMNPEYNLIYDSFRVFAFPVEPESVVSITPTDVDDKVWFKSMLAALNIRLDCLLTEEESRRSRVGLFDVKGRHHIVGITDVGSTETIAVQFMTHSKEENRRVNALLTWGGAIFMQPPPDLDPTGCGRIYDHPTGWFVPGDSAQVRPITGGKSWQWTLPMTRVAAPSMDIAPRTVTWAGLWAEFDTWDEVCASFGSLNELWLYRSSPLTVMGGGSN